MKGVSRVADREARALAWVAVESDRRGEFERGSTEPVVECMDAEFVVAAAKVLHERVHADDNAHHAVALQATQGAVLLAAGESFLESGERRLDVFLFFVSESVAVHDQFGGDVRRNRRDEHEHSEAYEPGG